MGCRERAARNELLRVVAGVDEEGRVVLLPDPRRAAPGRGAHLHPTVACFDLAVRRKVFGRALRVRSALDVTAVEEWVAARDDHAPRGADVRKRPATAT